MALPTTERVIATAMAAGAGYNTGAVTWPVGRRGKRPPNRAEIRAQMRRRRRWLRKHGRADADLAALARIIAACGRHRLRDRCRHPACPRCAAALQRLFVHVTHRFTTSLAGQAWMTVSIILPVSDRDEGMDFVAYGERTRAMLQEVGITVGVFGLDMSCNEDHRTSLPESERFASHACVHLYGLALATEAQAAIATLKRLIPRTETVPRPVRTMRWDGGLAAIAYALKPDFQRRQTIEKFDETRGKMVRTTRDRPLTVDQRVRAVRALDRAGMTGRIVLLGLRFELADSGQLQLVRATLN
ncbi:hypothetical protein HNR00_001218 [Methylorubrum rhodinum]|uniref:Replication protein n=1 Tax=Methylorubrum rhodinum TaxID=29428 RepID=A0A840ZGV3_9HYPH|nr:hypothetical protein [Methylorubrum rhodinum]MBB5756520.1 hypothetical protein [Methylorubrum rhodinum]